MFVSFNAHYVARIEVSACSRKANDVMRVHWQKLALFDSANNQIGQVILFLNQPTAALAIGDLSELDGFQAPALPAPALRLVGQVGGF